MTNASSPEFLSQAQAGTSSDDVSSPSVIKQRRVWALFAQWLVGLSVLILAFGGITVWQKMNKLQAQMARQQQDMAQTVQDARALSRHASDVSVQTAAKVAILDAKMDELVTQKAQVDDVLDSLSRSRVENLVVEIEASLLLAQQQSQMTGSAMPLLSALSAAIKRIERSPSPRLTSLDSALRRDLERLRTTKWLDTPSLLGQVDELVQLVDVIAFANSLPKQAAEVHKTTAKLSDRKNTAKTAPVMSQTSNAFLEAIDGLKTQLLDLVRLQKIQHPDAIFLNPEQAFFVRENIKLKLLNARIGLMTRQYDVAQRDLQQIQKAIESYCDTQSTKGAAALLLLAQIRGALTTTSAPTMDASLNALAVLMRRR